MVLYCIPQGTGTLAVDNAHGRNVGEVGIIKVFVKMGKSLVHSHAYKIDFRGKGCGLGCLQGTGTTYTLLGTGFAAVLKNNYIIDIDLGVEYTHCHGKVAAVVRKCMNCSFKVHAQNLDTVAYVEILGCVFLV